MGDSERNLNFFNKEVNNEKAELFHVKYTEAFDTYLNPYLLEFLRQILVLANSPTNWPII